MPLPELANDCLLPELFRDEVFRLETRRLWLRWPCAADAPALIEIAAVAACAHQGAKWPVGWNGDVAAVPGLVEQLRAANATGEGCFLGLVDKSRPALLVGLVGLDMKASGGPSLGLMLDVRRQGFGIMTEAARGLMGAVFRYSRTAIVRGDATLFGIGARRVLEKCGFRPRDEKAGADAGCQAFEAHRSDIHPRVLPREPGQRAA